jgi:hypothetical protein
VKQRGVQALRGRFASWQLWCLSLGLACSCQVRAQNGLVPPAAPIAPPTVPAVTPPVAGQESWLSSPRVDSLLRDLAKPIDLTVPMMGVQREAMLMALSVAVDSFPAERLAQMPKDATPWCEPGQLLVLWLSPEAARAGVKDLAESDHLQPVDLLDLPALGGVLARYQLADNATALALRSVWRERHPDWVLDFNATSTLAAGPRLYALDQLLPAPPSQSTVAGVHGQLTGAQAGLVLGVIDGPTDAMQDLAVDSFEGKSMLWPGEHAGPTDHGNAVARLLAARLRGDGFAGVAPGIALKWASVTRAVPGGVRSHTLAQVMALDWLLGQRVAVVNVSMGGPGDAVLSAAFRIAAHRAVVVAAVGNGGAKAEPVYPAAYPDVLAVTAVDARFQVYEWANRGPQVSLSAPGVDVWVPVSNPGLAGDAGPSAGQYLSGTSFASALASGMLARWGADRLQQARAQGLAPICAAAFDLGPTGRDALFGCGLVR